MDLFDRTEQTRSGAGERAILVHLDLPDAMGREDLDEFIHLVLSVAWSRGGLTGSVNGRICLVIGPEKKSGRLLGNHAICVSTC